MLYSATALNIEGKEDLIFTTIVQTWQHAAGADNFAGGFSSQRVTFIGLLSRELHRNTLGSGAFWIITMIGILIVVERNMSSIMVVLVAAQLRGIWWGI